MAKKRVHEIAKEKGISSKEVLAILQKAGFDVKAAASSVDEADVARAFGNGAASDDAPAAKDQPAEQSPQGDGDKAAQGQPARGERPARSRPTRGGRAGEQAPGGGGGRRRRVVIDSQAARRDRPPPPPQQPARRGRGRRRRPRWVEPDLEAEAAAREAAKEQEEPATEIQSGATVKRWPSRSGSARPR